MIIVDTETTGVDSKLCSLLSVGAVDFDNPTNQFYIECFAFSGAHIEKEALAVNGFRMEEIIDKNQIPKTNDQKDTTTPRLLLGKDGLDFFHTEDGGTPFITPLHSQTRVLPLLREIGEIKMTDREVVQAFLEWMKTCAEWTLAGQNPSFDRDFLQETAHRYHINWPLAHRTIDLHSVAYYHLKKRGIEPPQKNKHSALNLDRILEYVGLPTRVTKHNALDDAKLEAEALSRLFHNKCLFSEYATYPIPELYDIAK